MRRTQGQGDKAAVHAHRGGFFEAVRLPRKDRSRQAEKPRRAGATRQVTDDIGWMMRARSALGS